MRRRILIAVLCAIGLAGLAVAFPHTRYAPVSPMIELYEADREPASTSLAAHLTHPALFSEEALPAWAAATPATLREPVYLVLSTESRAARVRVRGFGRFLTVALAPHDVAVARLQRPRWLPRWAGFETLQVHVLTGPVDAPPPCILRLARSPEEAARMALDLGRADRAFALLQREQATSPSIPGFLAAAESGHTNEEAAQLPALANLLAQLDTKVDADAARIAAGDAGADRDHKGFRLRFDPAFAPTVTIAAPERTSATVAASGEISCVGTAALPALLAAGRYELQALMLAHAPAGAPAGPFEIEDANGDTLFRGDWSAFTSAAPIAITLPVRYARQPRLRFNSAVPLRVELTGLELRWRRSDLQAALRSRVIDALARTALARSQPAEARAWLDSDAVTAWDEVARRTLRFQMEWASPIIDYGGLRASAKALLERAPAHFSARELLQVTEKAPLYSTRHREAGSIAPVPFVPFASIINAIATNGVLRCVLEVERGDMPPLRLVLQRQRRGRWKDVVTRPVGTRTLYHEGERIVVDLPLPRSIPLERLAVGLRAQGGGASDWLPSEGGRDRAPLSRLQSPPAAAPSP